MSTHMTPPRRLVRKAFDGSESVRAFILGNTKSVDATKMSEIAEYLMNKGVCPTDVSKMLGLPMASVKSLAGDEWVNIRVGRLPASIAQLMLKPEGHLRASVFVNYVFTLADVRNETNLSGETYAYAMMAMDSLCGDFGIEACPPRYLLLAVMEIVDKKCELVTCGTCRTRYLKSIKDLKIQKGCFSRGECPYCKHVKTRLNSTRRLNGHVTKKTNAFSVEPQTEAV